MYRLNTKIMIQYTNFDNQLITAQQMQAMQEYNVVTIDDISGKIEKIEQVRFSVRNGERRFFEYFLNVNEDKNSIIQEYINKENFIGITLFFNHEQAFGFDQWEYEEYGKTGLLAFKGKRVFDNQNRVIANVSYDLQTGDILSTTRPKKFLYLDHFTMTYEHPDFEDDIIRDVTITFIYKLDPQTGETFIDRDSYLSTKQIEWNEELMHLKFDDFLNMYPSFMEDNPYYSTLYPLLPNTENEIIFA